jgi:hypothetical protein
LPAYYLLVTLLVTLSLTGFERSYTYGYGFKEAVSAAMTCLQVGVHCPRCINMHWGAKVQVIHAALHQVKQPVCCLRRYAALHQQQHQQHQQQHTMLYETCGHTWPREVPFLWKSTAPSIILCVAGHSDAVHHDQSSCCLLDWKSNRMRLREFYMHQSMPGHVSSECVDST